MNKKIKVGINGFGRIGRAFYRLSFNDERLEVVAINDLGSIDNMSYLLKHDSVYRDSNFDISFTKNDDKEGVFHITDKNRKEKDLIVLQEKDPKNINWSKFGVDVVVESTGFFTEYDKAYGHIEGGAKRVVISAPGKIGEDKSINGGIILLGVNEEDLKNFEVTSNASCTTNAASPLIAVLDEKLGIQKAMLSTTHAYTASQSIVDGPSKKDLREGRAGAINIVPTSTGAAKSITQVYKNLQDKFDGISLRVPVPSGSILDITFLSNKNTSKEEVNEILKNASIQDKWKNLLSTTEEELVSSDILGFEIPCLVDLNMTRVVDGNLVKVLAWYDNEIGYTKTLVEHVIKAGLTID
jgi:glyceraldehyde 3-phosphate dehydrogenase